MVEGRLECDWSFCGESVLYLCLNSGIGPWEVDIQWQA